MLWLMVLLPEVEMSIVEEALNEPFLHSVPGVQPSGAALWSEQTKNKLSPENSDLVECETRSIRNTFWSHHKYYLLSFYLFVIFECRLCLQFSILSSFDQVSNQLKDQVSEVLLVWNQIEETTAAPVIDQGVKPWLIQTLSEDKTR